MVLRVPYLTSQLRRRPLYYSSQNLEGRSDGGDADDRGAPSTRRVCAE